MWAEFRDEHDVLEVAVEALSSVAQDRRASELGPVAEQRAAELAAGEQRQGYYGGRSSGRVALAPLAASPILDALTLDDSLGDTFAMMARNAGLVPQSVGVTSQVRGDGVSLTRAETGLVGQGGFITVGVDGAVVVDIDIGGDGQMAGSRVDPDLLARGVRDVGAFALAVWESIDRREEVQQVAAAIAILNAQHKVFDLAPNATAYSMATGVPPTVVVPDPPAIIRRGEVAGDEFARRVVAEARRIFADAGAVAR
jgi:hypothetical protein